MYSFYDWLLPLSFMLERFSHVVCTVLENSFSMLNGPLCDYATFIFLTYCCWAFGLFSTILNCAANKILVDFFFLVDIHISGGFMPRSRMARL